MTNRKKYITTLALFFALFSIQFLVFAPSAQAKPAETTKLENPLGGGSNEKAIENTLSSVIKVALGLIGSITLFVFVIGGVMWLTSGGSPERVKMGTNTMLYAVIGVFVIFTAYFVLKVIIEGITNT